MATEPTVPAAKRGRPKKLGIVPGQLRIVTVALTADMVDALDAASTTGYRSRSQQVRLILAEWLFNRAIVNPPATVNAQP